MKVSNSVVVFVVALGCAEPPVPGVREPVGSVPNSPRPQVDVETVARGYGKWGGLPRLYLIPPAEGESCQTGWMTDFLAAGPTPLLVIPADPFPGMEFEIPVLTADESVVGTWSLPRWVLGDALPIVWSGGTWTFTEWSSTDVEVEMTGGETCVHENGVVDLVSCMPDSGTIRFHAAVPEVELVLTDPGYTGEPHAGYVDPVSGEPLCSNDSSSGTPETGTGE